MFLILILATHLAAPSPITCQNLKFLTLVNTTVTAAEFVPAGPVAGARGAGAGRGQTPASTVAGARGQGVRGGANGPAAQLLPAYCRVAAVVKPSADSSIGIEVWMPAEAWNGKFQAVGNGGWAGSIQGVAGAMPTALRAGYATAGTDTGHTGANGAFALGHPERIIDFGYRAIHEMTVQAKAIIKAYYDRPPKYSYFNGCSTGGRQALMEAQRYPDDYDGILAGAPANNQVHLHAADISRMIDIYRSPTGFLPPAKQTLLAKAVMDACDAIDLVKDNILSRPRLCKFDPATLMCKAGDSADCLTVPQVQTVKRAYAATETSKGELIFPGYMAGGESAYTVLRGGTAPGAFQIDTFRYLGHQDANWDWHTFDVDKDVALANKNAGFINATDPDLSKFKARGGKLILYHGWADALIPPENTINYYDSVLSKMGRSQDNWMRLFMAPGMNHCGGGAGPNQFDAIGALETWREKGTAPDEIIAVNAASGMTRPLCPYPKVPQFKGPIDPIVIEERDDNGALVLVLESADSTDAANFVCKSP